MATARQTHQLCCNAGYSGTFHDLRLAINAVLALEGEDELKLLLSYGDDLSRLSIAKALLHPTRSVHRTFERWQDEHGCIPLVLIHFTMWCDDEEFWVEVISIITEYVQLHPERCKRAQTVMSRWAEQAGTIYPKEDRALRRSSLIG